MEGLTAWACLTQTDSVQPPVLDQVMARDGHKPVALQSSWSSSLAWRGCHFLRPLNAVPVIVGRIWELSGSAARQEGCFATAPKLGSALTWQGGQQPDREQQGEEGACAAAWLGRMVPLQALVSTTEAAG